jgi:hypothetical protein
LRKGRVVFAEPARPEERQPFEDRVRDRLGLEAIQEPAADEPERHRDADVQVVQRPALLVGRVHVEREDREPERQQDDREQLARHGHRRGGG